MLTNKAADELAEKIKRGEPCTVPEDIRELVSCLRQHHFTAPQYLADERNFWLSFPDNLGRDSYYRTRNAARLARRIGLLTPTGKISILAHRLIGNGW